MKITTKKKERYKEKVIKIPASLTSLGLPMQHQ
jgi:hypothetical protein